MLRSWMCRSTAESSPRRSRSWLCRQISTIGWLLLTTTTHAALVRTEMPQRTAPSTAPPPAPAAMTPPRGAAPAQDGGATEGGGAFSPGQLEQLVAPIALYPDALLSQILMASTYPLQIVEADRWVKANPTLTGDAAARSLESQPWDPSVKSLINFPQVLDMMSSQLTWTQNLGDAFVTEQKATMDAVQSLRARAKAQGNLQSNQQQTVSQDSGSQTIVIQPASPDVIYVPTYDPTVVYGPWAYPAYPPFSYYPPGYAATAAISFGVGVACGFAWGYAWGHCDWDHGDINVNVNQNRQFNQNINRQNYINNYQNNIANSGDRRSDFSGGQGTWQHDPGGRGGVPYGNGAAANRFGGYSQQQAEQARQAFRGKAEEGRLALDQGAASQFRGANAPTGAFDGAGDPGRAADRGSAARQEREFAGDRRGAGSGGAFGDMDRGGDAARSASDRGVQSRSGSFSQNRGSFSGGSRSGGNFSQWGGGSYGGYRGGGIRGGGGRGGRR